MKIGILTYHAVPNFGANLQAFSTQSYLKKKGYDPIIINWIPSDLEEMYTNGRISSEQVQMHKMFSKKHLWQTSLCRTEDDIINVIKSEKIGYVIIGSDALWKHVPKSQRRVFSKRKLKYVNLKTTSDRIFPNPFWGTFNSKDSDLNLKLYAFSVSSQNMPYFKIKGELKDKIGTALSTNFEYITVRDNWTKQLVKYFTNHHIIPEVTPDPVFAFNNNVDLTLSKEYILQKYNLPDKYILASFRVPKVNSKWIKEFEKECTNKGIACVGFPMPEGLISFGLKKNISTPLYPLDWYCLIKYATGYIGERMHPIIVAIHNNVPFFCFDEYGTYKKSFFKKRFIPESSKIYDILQRGNLTEYMYSYNGGESLPTPQVVFNKILFFNSEKCNLFLSLQAQCYALEMEKILKTL